MSKPPDEHFAALSALMTSQLRVKGRDFPAQVRRAGRLLPRKVRRDARYLIDAAKIADNPKLAALVDRAKTERAYRNIKVYLEGVDPRERRITQVLNVLASIALGMIVVFVIVLYVLVQRGYV